METAGFGLQFLDLGGAPEAVQSKIKRALSAPNKFVQLPWVAANDNVKEEVEDQIEEQQWTPVQYEVQGGDNGVVEDDERGAGVEDAEEQQQQQQAPRNSVFPSAMLYFVPPPVYIPSMYNSPQHYPYPEVDASGRPSMPRGTKKMDKKVESSYPMQYLVQYPQPMYQPMYPPMPVYADYSPNYMPGPEHGGGFQEDQSYIPVTAPPPVPVALQQNEVKEEPPLAEPPVPEFPTHEHLCYQASVTLKPPKKKQPEEVVARNHPVEEPSAPIIEIPAPLEQPVQTSVVSEPSVDATFHSTEVEIKSVRSRKSDFPDLGPTSEPSAATAVPPSQSMKSWVSLFSSNSPVETQPPVMQTTNAKPRPLARVPPFDKNGATSFDKPVETPTKSVQATRHAGPTSFPNGAPLADDPYLHRVGEVLGSHKLDHRAVSLQPRGLTNRSNWCYVNAILQALIACPSFYNLMKALPLPPEKRSSSRTPITEALVEFVNLFPTLPPNTRHGNRDKRNKEDNADLPTGSSFEPLVIHKVLDKIRGDNGFTVEGRQEDAEEFLSCLLNGLNDEMFEVLKLVNSDDPGLANGDVDPEGGDGWKEKMPRRNKGSVTRRTVCGKTPISDIFRGQLRNRVQRAGDEYTDNVQPFFTLQLDVEKANSVKEALELLVGKDPLEGMTCSKTNQEIEAWTQNSLEDLPLILILHLKCFDFDKQDGCSKIMKTVSYSVELKVDPKLMSVNKNKYVGKQRNYKLVAVVYHDGKEATKGHYVTDAYHVGLGSWIRYDDGNVRAVNEESVLNPKTPRVPYLLYYRRADTVSQSRT